MPVTIWDRDSPDDTVSARRPQLFKREEAVQHPVADAESESDDEPVTNEDAEPIFDMFCRRATVDTELQSKSSEEEILLDRRGPQNLTRMPAQDGWIGMFSSISARKYEYDAWLPSPKQCMDQLRSGGMVTDSTRVPCYYTGWSYDEVAGPLGMRVSTWMNAYLAEKTLKAGNWYWYWTSMNLTWYGFKILISVC
jgi:hypothetical protein